MANVDVYLNQNAINEINNSLRAALEETRNLITLLYRVLD